LHAGGLACRLLYDDVPMPLQRAIAAARGAPAPDTTPLLELPRAFVEAGWVPWAGEAGFRAHLRRVAITPDEWRRECAEDGESDADAALAPTTADKALQDTLTGGGPGEPPPRAKL